MFKIKENGNKIKKNNQFVAKSIKLVTEIDLDNMDIRGYLMLIAVVETGELILYFTDDRNKIDEKINAHKNESESEFNEFYGRPEYEEIEYNNSITDKINYSCILLDCLPTHSYTTTLIADELYHRLLYDLEDSFYNNNPSNIDVTEEFVFFDSLFFNIVMDYTYDYEKYKDVVNEHLKNVKLPRYDSQLLMSNADIEVTRKKPSQVISKV